MNLQEIKRAAENNLMSKRAALLAVREQVKELERDVARIEGTVLQLEALLQLRAKEENEKQQGKEGKS